MANRTWEGETRDIGSPGHGKEKSDSLTVVLLADNEADVEEESEGEGENCSTAAHHPGWCVCRCVSGGRSSERNATSLILLSHVAAVGTVLSSASDQSSLSLLRLRWVLSLDMCVREYVWL
ncbi:hypothetical protein E2C01_046422 [Portunus trituberculatus]|uniref:Uncharacterized protein n=1 Tax=Portunus trituberculatus TaxID=210409 RepID=A0A5B7FYE8_PORTR|nr:hypothetical protein [Portunus trituberculatus]